MKMAKQSAMRRSLGRTGPRALALVAACAIGLAMGAGGSLLLANENPPPCDGVGVAAGPDSGLTVSSNVTCNGVSGCLVRVMKYPVYNNGCSTVSAPNSNCAQTTDAVGTETDYVGCTTNGCNETVTATKAIVEPNFIDSPC